MHMMLCSGDASTTAAEWSQVMPCQHDHTSSDMQGCHSQCGTHTSSARRFPDGRAGAAVTVDAAAAVADQAHLSVFHMAALLRPYPSKNLSQSPAGRSSTALLLLTSLSTSSGVKTCCSAARCVCCSGVRSAAGDGLVTCCCCCTFAAQCTRRSSAVRPERIMQVAWLFGTAFMPHRRCIELAKLIAGENDLLSLAVLC